LGKEHVDTLVSMGEVGATVLEQGRYQEAEAINKQTMFLLERESARA
jgi:hypothetical protein